MTLTPRLGFSLVFAACAGLLGYAYYAQFVLHLDPCPLCVLQRVAFIIMGGAALVGAVHGPRGWGRWLYGAMIFAGAAWGAVTAGRHMWLQSLPEDQVPACGGMGLDYMLDTFPLTETIRMVFTGSGECAEIDWAFLGLSMPGWVLVWLIVLSLFTLGFLIRRNP